MNPETRFRKSTLHCAVVCALTLGTGTAHAASEVCINPAPAANDSANFTMLSSGGGVVGGTNDVTMSWDGTAYSNSSDYTGPGSTANVTASSTTSFFGFPWIAHDIQMFLPGSYTFDATAGNNPGDKEIGALNVTVPSGMLGMHMLFDWNGNFNIDVFIVVAPDTVFGSGLLYSQVKTPAGAFKCDANFTGTITPNCLNDNGPYGSDGAPVKNQSWMLGAVDGNGDGIMGIPMPSGGPFQGFNANFNMRGTFAGPNLKNTCATFVDTIPDAFGFTSVTDAAQNTIYESNTITVSGLASGVTTAISVTGGQYSKDNGTTWASTAGTVQNGNTVKVRGTSPAADGLSTSVVLTIGGITGNFSISTPAIAGIQASNFTMLDPSGGLVGGTNDVIAAWDGTFNTNVNDPVTNATARMTLSSVTPFFQNPWTAHHIRVFGPGTYTIDSTCTVAQLEAGTAACNNPLEAGQTQRNYTFTVSAGQVGAHMLFDWNTTTNIDVVDVWNQDQVFGTSPMHTGDGACNDVATVWDLMSSDWDGDGQNGAAMIDGPFKGFKANFNVRLPGSVILPCSAYTPTVNVGEPTGTAGGGCSISPAPGKALERGDLWLVAGFLTWLGALRMRFKRQAKA